MQYTIANDRLTVTVDSLGAELAAVRGANGIDYLWEGDPAYWHGRAPILFPFVGALRDGVAQSARGPVSGARHGFARHSRWTLASQGADTVTLRLTDSGETRADYPYAFSLELTYALEGDILRQTYTVHNTDTVPLPYCLGGHTGFRVPLVPGEEFEDYTVTFSEKETADCPCVDIDAGLILDRRNRFLTDKASFVLNHVLFRGDALVFDRLRSRRVTLASGKCGHGVEMDFSGWDYFAVWSPFADAPFVCLEPWTGTATVESEDNVFEHKRGMAALPAGETAEKAYTMRFF